MFTYEQYLNDKSAKELTQYTEVLRHVLLHGAERGDRTETGTLSCFGYDKPLVFTDVGERIPLVNQKHVPWNPLISELVWFLTRGTNLKDLKNIQFGDPDSEKRTVWDTNYENEAKALGYSDGEMGPIYGKHMGTQFIAVLKKLSKFPEDRQAVMSNWQFDDIPDMALPPCHGIHTQLYVQDGKVHLNTTMRSTDIFLGLPFNIASYAVMLLVAAEVLGLKAGNMKMYLVGDFHIYKNHIPQVMELLERKPMPENKARVVVADFDFLSGMVERTLRKDHFELVGYESQGIIKAPMAFKKI